MEVDIYQFMGSGAPGDLLSPAIMNASTRGRLAGAPVPAWSASGGSMWVSADRVVPLPGKVTVLGTDYSAAAAYTWTLYYKTGNNYVTLDFGDERQNNFTPYHDKMTVACFYTPGPSFPASAQFLDTIGLAGTSSQANIYNYGVLSVQNGNTSATVSIHAHTEKGSSPPVYLTAGRTYWVNLHYSGPEGKAKVAAFDPGNNWKQVGPTSEIELQTSNNPLDSQVRSRIKLGRFDNHGDYASPDNPQSYFGHILVDYTHAAFPLLPDRSDGIDGGRSVDGAGAADVSGDGPSSVDASSDGRSAGDASSDGLAAVDARGDGGGAIADAPVSGSSDVASAHGSGGGCGCSTAPGGSGALVALLSACVLLGLRRARNGRSR